MCMYRYDGQMCIQDDFIPTWTAGQPDLVTVVNSYAPGGRGLDAIYHFENNSTTSSYPVYDGHGNTVSTIVKNGSSFTVGNARTYDVWGGVRTGATTGGPDSRYCGNLGHKQDDETGLIYMRARYYEPGTGRFVSEDPGRNGGNWYAYANQQPTSYIDNNGKMFLLDFIFSFVDRAKYTASQIAFFVNQMQTVAGMSVARIMTGQLKEAVEFLKMGVETGEINNPEIIEALEKLGENPDIWQKVYITLVGRGELTGEEYEILIHLFSSICSAYSESTH